jgi:hypothetical protein
MSTDDFDTPLLDFAAPLARLRRLAPAIGALAVVGATADALTGGLSVGVAVRWLTAAAAMTLAALAVLTALHALTGADRAQRRGERLAGEDVGLLPARRNGPDRPSPRREERGGDG